MVSPRKPHHLLLMALLLLGLILGAAGLGLAGKVQMEADAQMAAYEVFKQKCLACHDNIADPERPGKTRDGWTIVVKYMGDHYVDLNDQEASQIINLLYAIRKGLEKEPG